MKTAVQKQKTILLFANTTWYLYNFRLQLAMDLRERGYHVVLASPHDEYVQRIMQDGFQWVGFEISRRGMNPWKELSSIFFITKAYRQLKPDLVCHFTLKSVLYGSIGARLSGIPAVMNAITGLGYLYSHQSFSTLLQRWILLQVSRYALRHPNSVTIFQNESDRREFTDTGVLAEDLTEVIPGSGVNLDLFQTEHIPEHLEGEKRTRVVMVSRMLWDKGIGEIIEAVRLLQAGGSPIRITLAGAVDEGNPRSVRAAELRGWQEEGLIEWLGFVEDVPGLLQQSDLVILPSKYREGVPRSLIEAAAAGKPIITTDVPGCTDIVQDGYNGVIVPAGDAKALAAAIKYLVADPLLRKQMGDAGRFIVRRDFSVESVNSRLIRSMEKLLK
ncbi:MAG: glycosyltransferase family 4 protein [Anaerolineales bacterium]|nr:glycosyltransferase family 4 protein [Anaerolineales bacterium]